MLRLLGVTVRYGETVAVDNVSIDVKDGEVMALLGPSGCGKSTLLRAVAGIEPIAAGRIEWDGVDLAMIPVHRRGFGLMFQDGVLFPHRSVAGNVGYGLHGSRDGGRGGGDDGGRGPSKADRGSSRRWGIAGNGSDAAARVAELLDMVGLSGYGDRRVATLSGGEAQRVALARALAPNPRLLLLDEPLAALDSSLRDTLLADLAQVLGATQTTAIFVTHDQDEAFAIADRIALMRDGRIVQVGTPHEVWSTPIDGQAAVFLGRDRQRGRRFDAVRGIRDVFLAGSVSGGDAVSGNGAPASAGVVSAGDAVSDWAASKARTTDESLLVVVAGAVVHDRKLLIARRTAPPELAGKWELPGGKVETGETEEAALAREFVEELGLAVRIGARIGPAIPLRAGRDGRSRELRVFRAEPTMREASYSAGSVVGAEVRWVGADDLDAVDWVPADRQLIGAVRPLLSSDKIDCGGNINNGGSDNGGGNGDGTDGSIRRSASPTTDVVAP